MDSEINLNRPAQCFISAARHLRESIGTDIPIQQIMILVYLWCRGSANQVELARELDMKKAASSRHCKSLSSYSVQKDGETEERGQRLIIAERSATSGREMTYRLTEDSRKIMAEFLTGISLGVA